MEVILIKNQDLVDLLENGDFDFENGFEDLGGFDIEDNAEVLKSTSKDEDKEEQLNKKENNSKPKKNKNNNKQNNESFDNSEEDLKSTQASNIKENENIINDNEKINTKIIELKEHIKDLELELENKENSIYNTQLEYDKLNAELTKSNKNKSDDALEQEIEELKDLVYEQYGLEKKYKIVKSGFIIGIILTILLGVTSFISINNAKDYKIESMYSNISTQSIKENVTLSYLELVEESKMTYEEAFTFINSYPVGDKCDDKTKICDLYNNKLSAYDEFLTMLTNDPKNMTSIIKNYKLSLLDINENITNEIKSNSTVKTEDNKLILS